jgi:predicted nucleic acid-binding protein
LSRIGQTELLRKLFGSIAISASVYREIVEEAKILKKTGVSAIEDAVKDGWIEVVQLSTSEMKIARRLAESESIQIEDAEVLYLAKKRGTKLITNDKWLVKIARSLGIDTIWTTTLILLAVKKRILNKNEGKETLRKLILAGLHVRSDVYDGILSALKEL